MNNNVVRSVPFHLQIYRLIREQIISGQRKPKERLLEAKIAKELNVSRTPVREALRMLEQDGLIINVENALIVFPMQFEDIEEVYQCRIATEPYAAYLAADTLSNSDLSQLEKYIQQAEAAYQNQSFEEVVESNTHFHDLIVCASGNKRLIEINDRLSSLILLFRNAELKEFSRPRDYLEEHRLILDALKSKNKSEVEKLVRIHIENDWSYLKQKLLDH
ncbi:GntR family transcriptional regulator [Neobacillus sp. SAB-20_R2A]|uniref:GntR family transcriptional regulator n=1 Tax=Neobacillus sp. SAB-20_R2A TaxID=3120519 RepID=UPI003C6E5155